MTRLEREAVQRSAVRLERVLDMPLGPLSPENRHDISNALGDLRLALAMPACAEKECA